ncbi:Man1-Src1p-C-terminal domain-containing protein [Terfezia claveryi]|nr:Man1-Src1p-C-terminal domain-containing protein [Terfezia claveryi]
MDEPAYLQPDFDPNTLKVPELRNLLLEYDVDYPSAAKKAVLVDLFNEHIAPRAQRIVEQRGSVRASSKGIVSVDRAGNALVEGPRRGSRRVRRKSVVDTDSDAGGGSDILESIIMSPVKKTPARRTASPSKRLISGRHSRVGTEDAGEPEIPRTVRKTRRSSTKPAESVPETPVPPRRQQTQEPDDDPEKSPFSMENVFQKSTPVPPASKESRRKTMQPRTEERISSRPGRRLTDFLPSTTTQETEPEEPQYSQYGFLSTSHGPEAPETDNQRNTGRPDEPVARTSTKPFEVSVSRLGSMAPMPVVTPDRPIVKIEKVEDDDLIPAGEEFTPEGAKEIAEAEEEGAVVPRRSGGRRNTSTPATASALWAVIAALLIAYFVWWRKEKIEIGYCGVGNTAPKGLKSHYHGDRDWATVLRPECEPCPPNAVCKPNYTAECKSDYVLVNSPFSLFGLIPLAPTCEPDSEKLRRIAILSDEAIKVLRKRAADVECGEIAPIKPHRGGKDGEAGKEGEEDKEGKEVSGSGPVAKFAEGGPLARGKGMDDTELYHAMYELKAPKLSDEQFNELFKAALEEVVSREEIEAKEDSTSLASLPLICSIRLSLLNTLASYRIELLSILAAILTIIKINMKLQQRRKNNELVTKYVHLVLDLLQRKAEMMVGSEREDDAAVPVVQMRDQVLRHEFNPERRQEVWKGVQGVVEHNSNVRAMSREVRGEVFRVWMWIGGVGRLEESPRGVPVKREDELGSGLSRGVKQEEWERKIEFPRIVA